MTTDRLAERRFEALVQWMAGKLSADGAVIDSVEVLEASGVPEAVEKWRVQAAPRLRRLQLPVQTGISRDRRVWVEVFDRSTEPRDQSAVDWITEGSSARHSLNDTSRSILRQTKITDYICRMVDLVPDNH